MSDSSGGKKIEHYKSFPYSDARILLLTATVIIALAVYLVATSFYSSLNHSKKEVLNRLRAVAFTAAYLIDGDEHEALSTEYTLKDAITDASSNKTYQSMHQLLQMVQRANNLESPVYTIIFHPPDSTFRFVITSSEFPYYRHEYKNFPTELLTLAKTGGVLDVYEDENGMWLSAFAPIRNSKGEVVALLEADEHFEEFVRKAIKELLTNSLISLLIIIPFVYASIRFLALSLRKRELVRKALQEQNEEIQTQNEVIIKNQIALENANTLIQQQNNLLEIRVAKRTRELIKSNEELSQFLYHSSHDVQAPVATLKGLVALLPTAPVSEQKDIINHLQGTLEKMDRMIKTLQAIHRSKTKIIQRTEVVVLNAVEAIREKLNGCKPSHLKIGVEVSNPLVKTDPELFEIILTELIRNSIQYCRQESDAYIKISSYIAEQAYRIDIEDNGDGISSQFQSRIFHKFVRANDRSTGMGMGLKIVTIGVKRLGGSIHYVPTQRGCKFSIRLPVTVV